MSLPQWKGLWDWSMKHVDSTGPGRFRPEDVDPEKMKWLDEALKHYMIDFSARMREIKTKLECDTAEGGGSKGSRADGPKSDEGGGSRGSRADGPKSDEGGGSRGSRADGPKSDEGGGGDQGPCASADLDLEEREALLEELMDIVSSIDYARDLHKIGGLPVLLELLDSPHPSLRSRAAEVVATCVANNPPVQQWFLEDGILPKLLGLTAADQPASVRAKALLALSALVRHFKAGQQALRDSGGLATLVSCLASQDRRLSRKAMTTLAYLLTQHRSDCAAAQRHGALPPLLTALTAGGADGQDSGRGGECSSQEDSDFRQAALQALLELAAHPETWAAVRGSPGLWDRLAALEKGHLALSAEEREAQAEELGLLRQLAALLAAAAPPALRPDAGDHVSVETFEAAGREPRTITVNEPAADAVAAGAGRDVGSGAADQGSAPVPEVPSALALAPAPADAGEAVGSQPLLLGPP